MLKSLWDWSKKKKKYKTTIIIVQYKLIFYILKYYK